MKIIISLIIVVLSFSMMSFGQQSCDYKAEILLESIEFTQESFNFKIRAINIQGPPANTTSAAAISIADGIKIKNYRPWTNSPISRQKTSGKYSPNLAEGIYDISAEVYVTCEDFNIENNADKKRIIIKSSLDSMNNQIPGDNVSVQPSGANAAPILCGNQAEKEVEKIIIKECPELDKTIDLKPQEIISECETGYESSSEKSAKFAVYFILAISIFLNIALVLRKKLGIL